MSFRGRKTRFLHHNRGAASNVVWREETSQLGSGEGGQGIFGGGPNSAVLFHKLGGMFGVARARLCTPVRQP